MEGHGDFGAMVAAWFGPWARRICAVGMVIMMLGGVVAYDILLSDCVYDIGHVASNVFANVFATSKHGDAAVSHDGGDTSEFGRFVAERLAWSHTSAVAIVCVVMIAAGSSSDPTTFVRLSAAGPYFMMYLVLFIVVQSIGIGCVRVSAFASHPLSCDFRFVCFFFSKTYKINENKSVHCPS